MRLNSTTLIKAEKFNALAARHYCGRCQFTLKLDAEAIKAAQEIRGPASASSFKE